MKTLTKLALFVTAALTLNLLLLQALAFTWRALFSKNFTWPDVNAFAARVKAAADRVAPKAAQ